MKISIKDTASLACVSTATVSKTINKKDSSISSAIRNRVLEIIAENNQGAYDAVTYMISCGYKHIAHLTGQTSSKPTRGRLEGYKLAINENGIEYSDAWVSEGVYISDWGYHGIYNIVKV